MHIPLNDLKRHYESIKLPIDAAISRVMASGLYVMGIEHDAFEKEFAAYHCHPFAIAVANGTDALELGLRSLGISPGDEVIMVANACMFAAIAASHIQAIPVFVDIDKDTLTMCPQSLSKAISPATRAIVLTHLYGKMADIDGIAQILKSYPHIKVLEDCSQAHGAQRHHKKAGTFFDAAAFSLYPTKNLGAFGDAGILITHSPSVYEMARKLRNYGWNERYHVELPHGRNSRLDELQAAILRVKLRYLDQWNEKRRLIAKRYQEASIDKELRIVHSYGDDYVAHLCVAQHPMRDDIRKYFEANAVSTAIHYPLTDDVQLSIPWRKADLSQTYLVQNTIFTLPCFPEMTDAEINHVCNVIKQL